MAWPPDLKTELGLSGNPLVQCGCGRTVNADMMRDVRPVKDLIGVKEDHRCDSCMEHFYRTQALSREDFYKAHDAPARLVGKMRQLDNAVRAVKKDVTE